MWNSLSMTLKRKSSSTLNYSKTRQGLYTNNKLKATVKQVSRQELCCKLEFWEYEENLKALSCRYIYVTKASSGHCQ